MPNHYVRIDLAQGYVKPASAEDLVKDAEGVTMPNLHRRMDEDIVEPVGDEVAPSKHSIMVNGVTSFRGIEHFYHDEESTTSEIP